MGDFDAIARRNVIENTDGQGIDRRYQSNMWISRQFNPERRSAVGGQVSHQRGGKFRFYLLFARCAAKCSITFRFQLLSIFRFYQAALYFYGSIMIERNDSPGNRLILYSPLPAGILKGFNLFPNLLHQFS